MRTSFSAIALLIERRCVKVKKHHFLRRVVRFPKNALLILFWLKAEVLMTSCTGDKQMIIYKLR